MKKINLGLCLTARYVMMLAFMAKVSKGKYDLTLEELMMFGEAIKIKEQRRHPGIEVIVALESKHIVEALDALDFINIDGKVLWIPSNIRIQDLVKKLNEVWEPEG